MKFKFDSRMKFYVLLVVIAAVIIVVYPFISTEGQFTKMGQSGFSGNALVGFENPVSTDGIIHFTKDMPLYFRYLNHDFNDAFSKNYYLAVIYNNEGDRLINANPITLFSNSSNEEVEFTWNGITYPSDYILNPSKYANTNFDFYIVVYRNVYSKDKNGIGYYTPKYLVTYKAYQDYSFYRASTSYDGDKCGSVWSQWSIGTDNLKCKKTSAGSSDRCIIQYLASSSGLIFTRYYDGSGWCTDIKNTKTTTTTTTTSPIASSRVGSHSARAY